jgi:prolyl 4-hydroxylase
MLEPASFNSNENFILGWYISSDLCKSIIEEQSGKKKLHYENKSSRDVRGYRAMPLIKLSKTLYDEYLTQLDIIKNLYIEKYQFLKEINKFSITKYHNLPFVQLQRYEPNNYYKALHCENYGDMLTVKRTLVFMTYLNSIENDGGTHFPTQNFTCEAKQGLTILWPAFWTHPHVGVPAKNDIKYILTGWYQHD